MGKYIDSEKLKEQKQESYEEWELRRGLIWHLKELRELKETKGLPIKAKLTYSEWIDWLEKQKEQKPLPSFDELTPVEKMNHPLYREGFVAGQKAGQVDAEQKPVEWSEEDESYLDYIEEAISSYYDLNHAPQYHYWLEEKLKSLRLQPKQEWSEEDEERLDSIIESYKVLLKDYKACHDVDFIPYNSNTVIRNVVDDINFLKSLRSRPKLSDNLPKWKKASAGTKLPSESVIRRDGEDPRFGSVAVYDCEYITINELVKLPKED